MDEVIIEYFCPECDTLLTYGSRLCPGCGAILEWLETREAAEEAPAEAQGTGAPAGAIEGVVAAPAKEGPAGGPATPQAEVEAEKTEPTAPSEVPPEAQPAETAVGTSAEGKAAEPATPAPAGAVPSRRGLYMGVFSRRGAVSYSVMALSALGTAVVLNWDTMFGGAGAETIGRMQLAAAVAGIALTVVAGAAGVWDAFHVARAAG
jgi:hypothetical protein